MNKHDWFTGFAPHAWLLPLALLLTAIAACDGDDAEDGDEECERCECPASGGAGRGADDAGTSVSRAALESVCALEAGGFTLEFDNPWFPLAVGAVRVLQGEEAGTPLEVRATVLDETEEVAGVTTRVLEEREEEDGEVVEISRNFFAQARDGSICYFGEDVDIYEGGEIVAHEGAWRAGEGDAQPGIVMPAVPRLGMSYAQETAPDADAWDHASHVSEGDSITVPAGTYTDTIRTIEWTPIEPDDISRKAYARDVGMIVDDVVSLVSFEP